MSCSKNKIANLSKAIYNIIQFSTSFQIGKQRQLLKTIEYIDNEKSILEEIKKTTIIFSGLPFGEI